MDIKYGTLVVTLTVSKIGKNFATSKRNNSDIVSYGGPKVS